MKTLFLYPEYEDDDYYRVIIPPPFYIDKARYVAVYMDGIRLSPDEFHIDQAGRYISIWELSNVADPLSKKIIVDWEL